MEDLRVVFTQLQRAKQPTVKPFKGQLLYGPPCLTFQNSTFSPHSAFMCFVWIWEQTAIISLYSINWLVCITETECVHCAVRTGYLNTSKSRRSISVSHRLMSDFNSPPEDAFNSSSYHVPVPGLSWCAKAHRARNRLSSTYKHLRNEGALNTNLTSVNIPRAWASLCD